MPLLCLLTLAGNLPGTVWQNDSFSCRSPGPRGKIFEFPVIFPENRTLDSAKRFDPDCVVSHPSPCSETLAQTQKKTRYSGTLQASFRRRDSAVLKTGLFRPKRRRILQARFLNLPISQSLNLETQFAPRRERFDVCVGFASRPSVEADAFNAPLWSFAASTAD